MSGVFVHKNFFEPLLCEDLSRRVMELKSQWRVSKHRGERLSTGLKIMQIGTESAGVDSFIGAGEPFRVRDESMPGGWRVGEFKNDRDHAAALLEGIDNTRVADVALLNKKFPDVFDILKEKVSNILAKPCEFLSDGTCFGFNVQTDYEGVDQGRSWHFDDQVRFYSRNKINSTDLQEQYSFTIVLDVPTRATFQYYESTFSDYTSNPWGNYYMPCKPHIGLKGDICSDPECVFMNGSMGDMTTVEMERGMLVLQVGRFLHRAGQSIFSSPDQKRITLQLFATEYNNVVYLYW
jgi:hypothetical protein